MERVELEGHTLVLQGSSGFGYIFNVYEIAPQENVLMLGSLIYVYI